MFKALTTILKNCIHIFSRKIPKWSLRCQIGQCKMRKNVYCFLSFVKNIGMPHRRTGRQISSTIRHEYKKLTNYTHLWRYNSIILYATKLDEE